MKIKPIVKQIWRDRHAINKNKNDKGSAVKEEQECRKC